MTEPSIHPPPGSRLMFASRHPLPAAPSPTLHRRQPSDDFISQLAPLTAVDTLRAPTGPVKACMDTATPAERTFATRAAVASRNIYEWLDELRDWPWNAQAGAGFQPPAPEQEKPLARGRSGSTADGAHEETPADPDESYIGCLRESEVSRYEKRIDEIQAELDKLEIEDIKKHVLQNHILPLSRPGTPASPTLERHFGMASLASYTKMEDITAVITATVVQALPNLSKLIRLMNMWSVRLTVLRRIPSWLDSVADAESAVETGWNTIKSDEKTEDEQSSTSQIPTTSALSRHDFDVMKLVLEKKISTAAQGLDYMLDNLEGRDDVLPEEWLDRMEAVERDFSKWMDACEKKICGAEISASKKPAIEHSGDPGKSGNAPVGTPSHLVINVEDVNDQTTHEEDVKSSVLGPDEPMPSVEEEDDASNESPSIAVTDELGSVQKRRDSNADESMFDLELDSDEMPDSTSRTVRSKSSTTKQARQGDRPVTPELVPANNARRVPQTPPREVRSVSLPLSDMPPVPEDPEDEDEEPLQTPLTSAYDTPSHELGSPIILSDPNGEDDHMRRQIADILQNIPAKIQLSSKPSFASHLNPPDLQLPYTKPRATAEKSTRSKSTMSTRTATPAFTLAPVARPRHQQRNQDIKMYHLSRANGEAPIKLFIRCVGENGERVMVRVGGGWADLGEYLKEYAIHHGRRSNRGGESRLEVRDIPRPASSMSTRTSASPPTRPTSQSRPGSALDVSPIYVKKTRKASAGEDLLGPRLPRTPLAYGPPRNSEPPSSVDSLSGSTGRSRSSSRLSWTEEESSLGMAGPRSSRKEIPAESLEWVESIKEKVRAVSGGHSDIPRSSPAESSSGKKFGEIGKVGGTKRLFRRAS